MKAWIITAEFYCGSGIKNIRVVGLLSRRKSDGYVCDFLTNIYDMMFLAVAGQIEAVKYNNSFRSYAAERINNRRIQCGDDPVIVAELSDVIGYNEDGMGFTLSWKPIDIIQRDRKTLQKLDPVQSHVVTAPSLGFGNINWFEMANA